MKPTRWRRVRGAVGWLRLGGGEETKLATRLEGES
jgi:hypothetical protein